MPALCCGCDAEMTTALARPRLIYATVGGGGCGRRCAGDGQSARRIRCYHLNSRIDHHRHHYDRGGNFHEMCRMW